ncbi:MAG: hypothetical protein J6D46_08645 [Lachnospiraceae bacterium]|nr:hypothetical protein [Lachnospiraceae bacterium]
MTITELNFDCARIAICDAGSFVFWLNISDPADRAFLDRAAAGPECARDGEELFELCGRFGIPEGLIAGKTDLFEVSPQQSDESRFFTCSFEGTSLLIVKSRDLMFWVDPVSSDNLDGLCLLGEKAGASDAGSFLALCREMKFPCGIIRDTRGQSERQDAEHQDRKNTKTKKEDTV